MPGLLEYSTLFVEGQDDVHSIGHLLTRHSIDLPDLPENNTNPVIRKAGSDAELLALIPRAVRLGAERISGFVLDADESIAKRWRSIAGRFAEIGVKLPDSPVIGGYVSDIPEFNTRVGVWIMPDNQRDGRLEDFLHALIKADDKLIEHARAATATAMELSPRFSAVHKSKAELHTWLAWQTEPGKPYGIAMKAGYFQQDTPAALAFVSWFRMLYRLD